MPLRFVCFQTPLITAFLAPRLPHRPNLRCHLCAVEKDSEFVIDQEKARDALQKLDEQLQTLSQKQIAPKKRVSASEIEPYLMTGLRTEDMPELSGSYLAYSAVALLILTFFNNIVFGLFIKPSVDDRDAVAAPTRSRDPFNGGVVQPAPPLKED